MPIRFLLLSSNMIPISLKVTLDLIKLFFSFIISSDLDMYDTELDYPAQAKKYVFIRLFSKPKTNSFHTTSSEIASDLGQVQYVLTDKTGTLTENKMLLKKCSINGFLYGGACDDDTIFTDNDLTIALASSSSVESQFFKALALCHTCKVSM